MCYIPFTKVMSISQFVHHIFCSCIGTYINILKKLLEEDTRILENSLKKLTEEGVIERHGKGKSTFYTRVDV